MIQLSDQQKQAIGHIGSPTLVVSGAGSGKTAVLTHKVASLIQNGYDSRRILAITFTNKAADELKTRLTDLTGLPADAFPWVRTFHSAAFRIIRAHCSLLGYERPLQIYATYQQQKLFKEILARMNFDKKHVPAVASHISKAKNSGDPAAYFDRFPRVSHVVRLADVFDIYERELFSRNAVDFDNILLRTRDLLRKHGEVREHYKELFQYILWDEYQDINPLQAALTDMLLGDGNLFCVGDDWQSIYQFRGSDVGHFLSFRDRYENARIFRLEQNFRSADEIVQVANHLIRHNSQKMEKKCFSKKQGGTVALNIFANERKEAEWISRKIRMLLRMGVPYNQMAVLYRTRFCSLSFEKAFRSFEIPYQMLGSRGFFERKEVLDIVSYLKSAVFPKDDVSFERVINIPKRGIGDKTVRKIGEMRTENMSLQEAVRQVIAERVMTPRTHQNLSGLIRMIDEIREMTPREAISNVLSDTDYLDYLMKYSKSNATDYDERIKNIKELIHSASKKQTLTEYLEEADLVREDKKDDEDEGDRGVKLSTIHASKGLEYQAVFIIGCEQGLLPHWKSMRSDALQEERRLMYVAITRSEKYLFISRALSRMGEMAPKSLFWEELEDMSG